MDGQTQQGYKVCKIMVRNLQWRINIIIKLYVYIIYV